MRYSLLEGIPAEVLKDPQRIATAKAKMKPETRAAFEAEHNKWMQWKMSKNERREFDRVLDSLENRTETALVK